MTDKFQGTNNADIQAGNLPASENQQIVNVR